MNERPRIAGVVTTFDRDEIEGYRHGREAFLEMVACELQRAAGPNLKLEFWCEPRAGGGWFEMKAKPA